MPPPAGLRVAFRPVAEMRPSLAGREGRRSRSRTTPMMNVAMNDKVLEATSPTLSRLSGAIAIATFTLWMAVK